MGISQSSQAVYFSVSPSALILFFCYLSCIYFLCYSLSPLLLVLYAVCSEKSPYSEVLCLQTDVSSLPLFSPRFKQTEFLQSFFTGCIFYTLYHISSGPCPSHALHKVTPSCGVQGQEHVVLCPLLTAMLPCPWATPATSRRAALAKLNQSSHPPVTLQFAGDCAPFVFHEKKAYVDPDVP